MSLINKLSIGPQQIIYNYLNDDDKVKMLRLSIDNNSSFNLTFSMETLNELLIKKRISNNDDTYRYYSFHINDSLRSDYITCCICRWIKNYNEMHSCKNCEQEICEYCVHDEPDENGVYLCIECSSECSNDS
jgi:hypothetical protein